MLLKIMMLSDEVNEKVNTFLVQETSVAYRRVNMCWLLTREMGSVSLDNFPTNLKREHKKFLQFNSSSKDYNRR